MRNMTPTQALAEAVRLWGATGAVHERAGDIGTSPQRGRLAPYRYTVGNGHLGKACTIRGQGDSWRAAFADATQARASMPSNGTEPREWKRRVR